MQPARLFPTLIHYEPNENRIPNTAPTIQEKHPPGLYVLFATELWERFGFYTLGAMLALYLRDSVQGMGWREQDATTLFSYYLMFVYASPLIGGWLADKWMGYRLAITVGALFFGAGYFLLYFPSVSALYLALTLVVIGNGFFKPNVSAMVGSLYAEGSKLKDSAYNIFYMGINIGAFLAPVVAEFMRQRFGFRACVHSSRLRDDRLSGHILGVSKLHLGSYKGRRCLSTAQTHPEHPWRLIQFPIRNESWRCSLSS